MSNFTHFFSIILTSQGLHNSHSMIDNFHYTSSKVAYITNAINPNILGGDLLIELKRVTDSTL